MSLTLRAVFDHISQGRNSITEQDLRRVAADAHATTTVMGYDLIAKMWDRLDPSGQKSLDWKAFCANGTALLPGDVTSNPEAAIDSAEKMFDKADNNPRDGGLSYAELRTAIAKQLPWYVPKKGADAGAQLTFALLGRARATQELEKTDLESLAEDIRRHIVVVPKRVA